MSNQEPVVKLIAFTPNPIEVMLFGFKNMHGQVPNSMEEFLLDPSITPQLRADFVQYLAAEPLSGGVQEFVNMVWVFKNVSRAFQQQLTRHRTAAYSIQSMRVVPKEHFAEDQQYHIPPNVKDQGAYEDAMLDIQDSYNDMLTWGEPTEVARGILPLNIFSPITMSINLRALIGLISARLCNMTQGEFKTVALMMIKEVCDKMGTEFSCLFSAPCDRDGFCPHAITCGKSPLLQSCKGRFNDRIKSFMRS